MREVEAQALVIEQRPSLLHMVAQDLLERGVEQVRGRVVPADELAAVRVDGGDDHVAHREGALGDGGVVGVEAVFGLGVAHLEGDVAVDDGAGVAHLAAHLGVERRVVEHDVDLLAGLGALDRLAVADDGEHVGVVDGVLVVAAELGGGQLVGEGHPHVVEAAPGVTLGSGARAALLLVHAALEARHVDLVTGRTRDLDREVDGKAVGVVQREGALAVEHCARLERGQGVVEVAATGLERGAEALLLGGHDALDQGDLLEELGVGSAHEAVDLVDELVEEGLVDAEQAAVEDRAAQQAAQHVAAALVAGQHAVGDEEVDRAGGVGDDAQAHARALVAGAAIFLAAYPLAQRDEALHEVAVVVGARVLHDGGHALEAHARVEVAVRQLRHGAVLPAVELREHEVPELEVAVTVAARGARGLATAELLALVKVDLGAGAARAGGASRPEVVVLAEAADVVLGHTERAPHVVGLVIVGEDGEVEALDGELEDLGDELEGPGAGLLLGDAAKGEVTEHLEEREVAAVKADGVDVVGAHALLAAAGADGLHRLLALVVLLELVHAGVGEQKRRVVGHEAGAGEELEPAPLEELEERRADLGGGHGRKVSGAHMSPLRLGSSDGSLRRSPAHVRSRSCTSFEIIALVHAAPGEKASGTQIERWMLAFFAGHRVLRLAGPHRGSGPDVEPAFSRGAGGRRA